MHQPQFCLKDSVYALEEPATGLYIGGLADEPRAPRLTPLRLATLAPATPYCRAQLAAAGAALQQPHELVRVDA